MRRRRDVQNMCFAFTQNLCLADTMVGLSIISVAVLSPPMKVEDENVGLQEPIWIFGKFVYTKLIFTELKNRFKSSDAPRESSLLALAVRLIYFKIILINSIDC